MNPACKSARLKSASDAMMTMVGGFWLSWMRMTTTPCGADHTKIRKPPRRRDSHLTPRLTVLTMKTSGASSLRGDCHQLGTDTSTMRVARACGSCPPAGSIDRFVGFELTEGEEWVFRWKVWQLANAT